MRNKGVSNLLFPSFLIICHPYILLYFDFYTCLHVSCEVGGGVVVQTYSKSIKSVKNVLRWLLELALMVNNI